MPFPEPTHLVDVRERELGTCKSITLNLLCTGTRSSVVENTKIFKVFLCELITIICVAAYSFDDHMPLSMPYRCIRFRSKSECRARPDSMAAPYQGLAISVLKWQTFTLFCLVYPQTSTINASVANAVGCGRRGSRMSLACRSELEYEPTSWSPSTLRN